MQHHEKDPPWVVAVTSIIIKYVKIKGSPIHIKHYNSSLEVCFLWLMLGDSFGDEIKVMVIELKVKNNFTELLLGLHLGAPTLVCIHTEVYPTLQYS